MPAARSALAVLASALALGACGGSGDDGPKRTVTAQAGRDIPVTGDEYSFDPEGIVVRGTGGGTREVRVALRNAGDLAHDLRVQRDGEDVGGTPVFTGGKTMSATVRLAPGKYTFYCSVGDHEELGMKGELEVR